MYGSGIIHKNISNDNLSYEIFKIITNPETKVKRMGVNSGGGFLFDITLPKPDEFQSLTSQNVTNVTNVICKIVVIGNNRAVGNISSTFKYKQEQREREVTTLEIFNEECNTQIFLYNQSYDKFLESICPKIIFYTHINSDNKRNVMNSTVDNEIINMMKYILSQNGNFYDIGFICMEKLNNMNEIKHLYLENYVQERQTDLQVKRDINEILTTSDEHLLRFKRVLDNYLYELIRLWRIGYTHGDTHLENAMYLDNGTPYHYIDGERVLLIDFGRTKQNVKNKEDLNFVKNDWEYMSYNITTLICNENIISPYWSYKLLYYYNNRVNTFEWYQNICKKRYNSKIDFLKTLTTENPITNVTTTITDFRYNFFDKQNIPPNAFTTYEKFSAQYLIQFFDTPIYYNNNSYELTTKFKTLNLDFFVYDIINQLKIGEDFFDIPIYFDNNNITNIDFIKHIFDNMPFGTYTWILYFKDNTLYLSFFKVKSYHQIGSKHYCIALKKQITYYYSAGEMKKEIQTNFIYNFISGSFFLQLKTEEYFDNYFNTIGETTCRILKNIHNTHNIIFKISYIDLLPEESFIKDDFIIDHTFFNMLLSNNFIHLKITGGKIQQPLEITPFETTKSFETTTKPLGIKPLGIKQNIKLNNSLIQQNPTKKFFAKNIFKLLYQYYQTHQLSLSTIDIIENKYDKKIQDFLIKHFKNDTFINNLNNIDNHIQQVHTNQYNLFKNKNNNRFGDINFYSKSSKSYSKKNKSSFGGNKTMKSKNKKVFKPLKN